MIYFLFNCRTMQYTDPNCSTTRCEVHWLKYESEVGGISFRVRLQVLKNKREV